MALIIELHDIDNIVLKFAQKYVVEYVSVSDDEQDSGRIWEMSAAVRARHSDDVRA